MPELPEVETVKNQLLPIIQSETIYEVYQSDLNLRGKPMPSLISLVGQKIINVTRRNKYVIIELQDYFLFFHLGMTGQLLFSENIPTQKHIHAYLKLSKTFLYFQDVRRFGKIELYSKKDYQNFYDIPSIKSLGIEPLSLDFNLEKLREIIKNKNTPAKKFIMDNAYICGIGNIYACEILFLSKIHPAAIIKNLTEDQINLLYSNIKSVLTKAIELGGSTISDFKHVNGSSGNMQNFYYVYDKEGVACKICGNLINRIKQYGRSTFYCSYCQSL